MQTWSAPASSYARRRLLDGPLRTLTGAAGAIETAAGRDEPDPAFLDVAERAREVHDQVRRFRAIADDPSMPCISRRSEVTLPTLCRLCIGV